MQKLTAKRICGRKSHRMHETIEPVPSRLRFFHGRRDVIWFGDVHLKDCRHRVELFRRHLRDAHHPTEAREQDLSAFLLRLLGDRKTDAAILLTSFGRMMSITQM